MTKKYKREEVARHTDPNKSILIIVKGNVLDVTKFVAEHPGGADIILNYAGKDVTDIFESIHSSQAKEFSQKFIVGKLV